MLRRAVVAASAATLVPAGVAGASIKVTADAESPALRVHRVPSRFQVPRYRALLPGPNLGAMLARDAATTAVRS